MTLGSAYSLGSGAHLSMGVGQPQLVLTCVLLQQRARLLLCGTLAAEGVQLRRQRLGGDGATELLHLLIRD